MPSKSKISEEGLSLIVISAIMLVCLDPETWEYILRLNNWIQNTQSLIITLQVYFYNQRMQTGRATFKDILNAIPLLGDYILDDGDIIRANACYSGIVSLLTFISVTKRPIAILNIYIFALTLRKIAITASELPENLPLSESVEAIHLGKNPIDFLNELKNIGHQLGL